MMRQRTEGLISHETLASALRTWQGPPTPRERGERRGRARRRALVTGILIAAFVCAGTAAAFGVRALLTNTPVTEGFSALDDPTLPSAPEGLFRDLGSGDYQVKRVAEGMFLARRGNALCEIVLRGAGACTDHLDGDVWLFGDQVRAYDSESAPFEVHFYGFARDRVSAIRVTTSTGDARTLPVEHNAFQTVLPKTTFAEIAKIDVLDSAGNQTSIDPRMYFPVLPSRLPGQRR
jgi:hypothetical protein